MLDGVFIGTNTMQLANNFDLERVEVLRGPQGTLFGKNTTAGVINMVSTRPTGQWGAKGNLTFGSFEQTDFRGVFNLPKAFDMLSTKIAVMYLFDEGFYTNVFTGEEAPRTDFLDIVGDVLLEPNEDLEIRLKYEHTRDRGQPTTVQNASNLTHIMCFGALVPPPAGPLTNVGVQCEDPNQPVDEVDQNFPNEIQNDANNVTGTIEWDFLENYRLTSITGWRGNDEDVTSDFDAIPMDFFSTRRIQTYDQVSQEARVDGQPFEHLHFVAGLYYWWAEYALHQNTFFLFNQPFIQPPPPPGTFRIQDTSQETNSIAGFLQFDWGLDFIPLPGENPLTLTGGFRYTWEKKEFNTNFGFNTFDLEPPISAEETWGEPTWRVGLDWQAMENLLGYFIYSRGFKSGGFNGRADSPIFARVPYDPEFVDSFELGVKSQWLDNRLRFNIAGFFTDYDDKQEQVVVPSPLGGQQTIVANAGKAKISGVEIEAQAAPIDPLLIFFTMGWLDAEYDEFMADLVGSGTIRDNTDFELRRAPEWTIGVGGKWTQEIQPIDGRAILDLQYRWRDQQRVAFSFVGSPFGVPAPGTDPGAPTSDGISPAFGSLDFALSLELDRRFKTDWRLTGFVRNALDESDRAAYLDVAGVFAFSANNIGRTWGLEIAANFH
jgi:iron complex outermembrane receptor protein